MDRNNHFNRNLHSCSKTNIFLQLQKTKQKNCDILTSSTWSISTEWMTMKLIMSWEGQAPCGAHWEEGSSLAQSWGQCFLPTVGAGLNDCPAAQENIWAPSASWHPLGWVWEHTGAFELPVCLPSPLPCEIRGQHSSSGQASVGSWFCVAALIPGPQQHLGTSSSALCHQAGKGWVPPILFAVNWAI